jgi:hypothetical protein
MNTRNLIRGIWTTFCYLWAAGIVIGVILLLRSDDTITPTLTDFVVIFGIALAPMLALPILGAVYRHLRKPAGSPLERPERPGDD